MGKKKHWWQNVGTAIAKGVSDTVNEVKRDYNRVTNNERPDPTKFNGGGVPGQTTSTYNQGGTPPGAPGGGNGFNNLPGGGPGGPPPGFNQQSFLDSVENDPWWKQILNTVGGSIADAWKFIEGLLPKDKDGNTDWGKLAKDGAKWLADNAVPIASAINNYQRQQQSDKFAREGLDAAKNTYAENKPLRDAGRAGLLNPTANAPDLSGLRNIAGAGSGNPFAKGLSLNGVGTTPPPTPSPQTFPVAPPATPRDVNPTPQAPPGLSLSGIDAPPSIPGTPQQRVPGQPPQTPTRPPALSLDALRNPQTPRVPRPVAPISLSGLDQYQ